MLNGVLFGRQSKRIIPHRVQYIKPLEAFVPAVYVTGDVSQGMTDMESRTTGVGKHIEYIAFGSTHIIAYTVYGVVSPSLLPFSLDFPESIFHCACRKMSGKNTQTL